MPDRLSPQANRSSLLDALRGFALIGVLLANLRMLSLYDLLPSAQKQALPTAAVDRVINELMSMFVNGTSITLFTLLFGVGFSLQMGKAKGSAPAMRTYLRRLLVLLVIGLAHAYLLWWGDILRYYAVLGLLLIPLARLPATVLVTVGGFVVLVAPLLLQPVIPNLLPTQISSGESAARALAAFSGEHLGAMLEGNLARDLRMRIAVWILPTYIFGRMLIGVALGNAGMLTHPLEHQSRWRRLWWGSLVGALLITALVSTRRYDIVELPLGFLGEERERSLWRVLYNAAPLGLGVFYMASFVLLYVQSSRWRAVLQGPAPLGRMALTNYMAQSIVGVAIFYGVGLGVGPRFGAVGVLLAALLILTAQAYGSRWWLARYRFGPMEWLWRSASYGKWQPMTLGPQARGAGPDA
ncbi:MAG: DUF418 domain-containing protein [Pseudomonadota bacterium]